MAHNAAILALPRKHAAAVLSCLSSAIETFVLSIQKPGDSGEVQGFMPTASKSIA